MDLDVANGARGHIVDIVLGAREHISMVHGVVADDLIVIPTYLVCSRVDGTYQSGHS